MGYNKDTHKRYYEANKERLRAKRRDYYKRNREKQIEYSKQYRLDNLEKVKENEAHRHVTHGLEKRLRRYGLTIADYMQTLDEQDNSCAICHSTNTNERDWHVDHCHTRGHVRGLLCHHCNLLLGNARDSQTILQSAIRYLQKESLAVA